MKRSLVLLYVLVIFSFQATSAQHRHYRVYARQWAQDYIIAPDGSLRIARQDLEGIIKLIDYSLRRSEATLKSQRIALDAINLAWKAWQNMTQTRLNPSHTRPHIINAAEKKKALEAFWPALEEQEALCKAYSQVAKEVVHGDVLSSTLSKDAVKEIRRQARIFMLDALTDVKKQLEGLYAITFNKNVDPALEVTDQDADLVKAFSISEFIMSYVPQLAVHQFIHADKLYNNLSQEGWDILQKIQLIGNQAWDAIETARVGFYRALLDEVKQL